MRHPILEDALSRKGAVKKVAQACGITPSAVCQWRNVPKKHVEIVARITGRHPDLFRGVTVVRPEGEGVR
ncbi:CI repressor [Komagataeibacter medellinensis]|uniref:CI repressor n=1 Tax=Komagataeibacter medellinensis TaxID=1177712 RepID=A0ABQ6VR65_9PROT|nr:CI repressor [Komagataeibacter medellinensis]